MQYHHSSVRLYTAFETQRTSTMVLESVVVLFFAYYILQEALTFRERGLAHFTVATVAHDLNLAMYVVVWVCRAASLAMVPTVGDVHLESDVFYSYRSAVQWKLASVYANSLNAFLCWFKLVRYLGYIPRFALVSGTLRRSAYGVSGFSIIFVVMLYGFAASHMLSFGSTLESYRNLSWSTLTLLRSLLGEFELEDMANDNLVMGTLFFVLFTAVAVLVILNTLIAIVSDAYSAEVEALAESEDVSLGAEMSEFVKANCMKYSCVRRCATRAERHREQLVHSAKLATATWRSRRSRGTDRSTSDDDAEDASPFARAKARAQREAAQAAQPGRAPRGGGRAGDTGARGETKVAPNNDAQGARDSAAGPHATNAPSTEVRGAAPTQRPQHAAMVVTLPGSITVEQASRASRRNAPKQSPMTGLRKASAHSHSSDGDDGGSAGGGRSDADDVLDAVVAEAARSASERRMRRGGSRESLRSTATNTAAVVTTEEGLGV